MFRVDLKEKPAYGKNYSGMRSDFQNEKRKYSSPLRLSVYSALKINNAECEEKRNARKSLDGIYESAFGSVIAIHLDIVGHGGFHFHRQSGCFRLLILFRNPGDSFGKSAIWRGFEEFR